jgi:DNA-binding CsgD family transcriptional regulator
MVREIIGTVPGEAALHDETAIRSREADCRRADHKLENPGDRVLEAHALGEEADSQAAAEVWRALVAGRWSVVDHCDREGKRYLLAVANPPDGIESSSLTAREVQILARVALRHSLKFVSYELGLSHSTVSGQLQSALRKLRLGSVAEAVRVLGAGQSSRQR